MRNCYDVLGCTSGATCNELKEAYFRKLRANHPDKGGSSSALFLVTKAWCILKNENTRRDYNNWLREQLLHEGQGIIGQHIVIDSTADRVEEFCSCGGQFVLEKVDIDRIVNSAYFECPNCSLCLEADPVVAVESAMLLYWEKVEDSFVHVFIISYIDKSGRRNKDESKEFSLLFHHFWDRHDVIPSSTVGCAVSVIAHQYHSGSADEQTELIELWDIGGSTVHQKASVNFLEGATGAILVHDLSNKKSELNLSQWLALLRGESALPSVISSFTSSSRSRFLLSDIENTPMPALVVGCKLDLAPERAKQTSYDRIFLNCRHPISPDSTIRIILSKFFDSVVERKKVPTAGDKRRKIIA